MTVNKTKRQVKDRSTYDIHAAITLHRAGHLQEAEAAYQYLLRKAPNSFDVHHMYALFLWDADRKIDALVQFKKTIQIDPEFAPALYNYGCLLIKTENYEEAIDSLSRAITLSPHSDQLYLARGNAYRYLREFEGAAKNYRDAIALNPRFTEAWSNLGYVLNQLHDYQEALKSYQYALQIEPERYEIYINQANVLRALNRYDDALECCKKAEPHNNSLELALTKIEIFKDQEKFSDCLNLIDHYLLQFPDNLKILLIKADFYRKQYDFPKAIEIYEKCLFKDRNNIDLICWTAECYNLSENYNKAYEYFLKAVAMKPESATILNNYGNCLNRLNRHQESIDIFSKAIKIDGKRSELFLNRALAHKSIGNYSKFMNDNQIAHQMNPNCPKTNLNYSISLFLEKNYQDAWNYYEFRIFDSESSHYSQPCIIPPSISISHHLLRPAYRGKRVYIASEQGIGDEIMFMSILPDLLEDAQHVTVKCYARSLTLLTRSFPSVKFIDKTRGEEIAVDDIDIAIRIGSLGYSYRRDMSTASGKPYLKTDPLKVGSWKRELPTDRPLIGLSWRGGTDRTNREGRTATLDDLRPLLERNEYKFVSLQHGEVSEELERFNLTVSNPIEFFPADRLRDLDDLAALIDTLDVVVSVQNTNVHLSGALGKTCFAMMPKVPEWRYGFEGTRMDWYKSVELMRPKDYGNFGGMARALQAKISRYLNGRSYDSE